METVEDKRIPKSSTFSQYTVKESTSYGTLNIGQWFYYKYHIDIALQLLTKIYPIDMALQLLANCFIISYRYSTQIITPPRNRGGVIFSLQFVCVCVCLSVCVSGNSCEQNSSRTNAPIWMRFSLNGCFLHWLEPY